MADAIQDIYLKLAENRVIFLHEEIGAEMATQISAYLIYLDSLNSEQEITLYINSPGGSVSDGFLTIYDTMQYVKSPIKTICIGEAYSGAGIILSAGSKGMRYACPNSEVMLHAVQVEDMSGTTQDIQKESKRIKVLNQKLMEIIAHHTGQSLRKVKRDCREDKFFSAKEALEYGIIDYIIEPSKTIAVLKKN